MPAVPSGSSSSSAPPTVAASGSSSGGGNAAVQAAESQLGVPYAWGGETPGQGFDCSGLTQWAWAQAGVSIPRTATAQYASIPHVSLSALQPGDLLFYKNLDGDGIIDHVVMYVGSGPYGQHNDHPGPVHRDDRLVLADLRHRPDRRRPALISTADRTAAGHGSLRRRLGKAAVR